MNPIPVSILDRLSPTPEIQTILISENEFELLEPGSVTSYLDKAYIVEKKLQRLSGSSSDYSAVVRSMGEGSEAAA